MVPVKVIFPSSKSDLTFHSRQPEDSVSPPVLDPLRVALRPKHPMPVKEVSALMAMPEPFESLQKKIEELTLDEEEFKKTDAYGFMAEAVCETLKGVFICFVSLRTLISLQALSVSRRIITFCMLISDYLSNIKLNVLGCLLT